MLLSALAFTSSYAQQVPIPTTAAEVRGPAPVGPVLSYAGQLGKFPFAAEVKWLPQITTQNTLKGDYVWFKVGVQF